MQHANAYAMKIAVMTTVLYSLAKTTVRERTAGLQNDRGDVVGWAIAAAATVVIGGLVLAAITTVTNREIGKIK